MSHRFDPLAKRLPAALWQTTHKILADVRCWLGDGTRAMTDLLELVRATETTIREGLAEMAGKLIVFSRPAPTRKGSPQAQPETAPAPSRDPLFHLGFAPIRRDTASLGETSRRSPSTAAASLSCKSERLTRRPDAIEDALSHPGRHGARYKCALHRREIDTSDMPIQLKSEDDIFLDHADRLADDPRLLGH